MNIPHVRSIGILLARIGFGVIFLAHGLQKADTQGYSATKAAFEGMGAPVPALSAFLATWVEIIGGIALIVGILTPIFGALLFLDMLGALFIAHIGKGIWSSDGGYEFVLALGAGALLLAAVGAGKFSIDTLLGTRFRWLATGNEPVTVPAGAR